MITREEDGIIYLTPETEEDRKKLREGIKAGTIVNKPSFADWRKKSKRQRRQIPNLSPRQK